MYLKSIELHGFKSFAMKTKFEFHNGITGIVGPNGSGKSNVSDAVRWVLGEQRVKQLRGSSMQDVIFAGTENRKPQSYAYVAICLDNSDHALPVDYEEVTIARRIYRSGESEYLINGTVCRLKDVQEMFYDTGIGKEGYSIIGQGQIERIISGKPEERRELFDEAAGIVKYKRRKVAAEKKLENERENLVRVNDIISELEKQVGPLEKQSEVAKIYLAKKERLKDLDINLFLINIRELEKELSELEEKLRILNENMNQTQESYEGLRKETEEIEQAMADMDSYINTVREEQSQGAVTRNNLENQIKILEEQVNNAHLNDEHYRVRMENITGEIEERSQEKDSYSAEQKAFAEEFKNIVNASAEAKERLEELLEDVHQKQEMIEAGKAEIIELLNRKATITAKNQHFETMQQQVNIRKAELDQKKIAQKSETDGIRTRLAQYEEEGRICQENLAKSKEEKRNYVNQVLELTKKREESQKKLEQVNQVLISRQSKLESLSNMAERYEGYGNSIRKVMEQKNAGVLGVVADIIKVEKKYETAIETALGGNIQNIVTEDEATAKEMISYLKENRLGRATFLPLTSVGRRNEGREQEALGEVGVLGMADTLVSVDAKYRCVAEYLLGRILVADTVDHALALAKKYKYALRIVTLEGESLQPGGSLTGGAFRNNSNLLGRNRELEEIEAHIKKLSREKEELLATLEAIRENRNSLRSRQEEMDRIISEQELLLHTANLNITRMQEELQNNQDSMTSIQTEGIEIENQIKEIEAGKEAVLRESEEAKLREEEIEVLNAGLSKEIESSDERIDEARKLVARTGIDEANMKQKSEFIQTNIDRVSREIERLENERKNLEADVNASAEEVVKKKQQMEEIRLTIEAAVKSTAQKDTDLQEALEKKEAMTASFKEFFNRREELMSMISDLEKEGMRLTSQKEKASASLEDQNSYMWNEYELTLHNAEKIASPLELSSAEMKKESKEVRDEIRRLGNVNVNAIEEYKEVSTRFNFLSTQRDDIKAAEENLLGIIAELDTGMRKQFKQEFGRIQKEFEKVFKELFGGGQ